MEMLVAPAQDVEPARSTQYRGYLWAFFAVVGFCCLAIVSLNVIVNPYRVFPTNVFAYYDLNPRLTKARSFASNAFDSTGVVFGSCLSSTLDPTKLAEASGKKFFNFSTHVSLTREPKAFLEELLKNGSGVKQVLLNVDNYLRNDELSDKAEESQMLQAMNSRWPPPYGKSGYFGFYGPYLFGWVITRNSLETAWLNLVGRTPPVVERADGFWDWRSHLSLLKNDPRRLAEEMTPIAKMRQNMTERPAPASLKSFIDLQQLKSLTSSRNIELKCFIPPSWALRPTFIWQGNYSEWQLRKMLEICGSFDDFRLINDMTLNSRNFFTYENFTKEVGDIVIDAIFLGKNQEYVYHVSSHNFDEYISFKRTEAKIYEREVFPAIGSLTPDKMLSGELARLASKFSLPN